VEVDDEQPIFVVGNRRASAHQTAKRAKVSHRSERANIEEAGASIQNRKKCSWCARGGQNYLLEGSYVGFIQVGLAVGAKLKYENVKV
jgi:hypothetical protein